MATKNNPGTYDCYAHAEPDEPLFVLLGRDKHAPTLIWLWAALRELDAEAPEKVDEARVCVLAMLDWQVSKGRTSIGIGQAALAAVFELIRAANAGIKNSSNPETDAAAMRLFLARTDFEDVAGAEADKCDVPPEGWWCSREKGHEGPCAARPTLVAPAP